MSAVAKHNSIAKRKDGSLSREHFSLREFRLVAKLRFEGAADEEIVERAVSENLFQYPTLSNAARMARTMLLRLASLNDEGLVGLAARGPKEHAAVINLYAMMRVYPLVREFMMQEIAPRFRTLDYSLTHADTNAFITRYQAERRTNAEPWTESTVKRIAGVLREALAGTGMLADTNSEELLPFFMDPALEDTFYRNGDQQWLAAFNVTEVL
ncbi:DUF1819 family protein [Adlercreutzia equolifaciens]|uniref:DUF1819 family protein n=1 Tax=Adlercreutzia equolifaciens TaxID=446660 RepID=UPI003AF11518